MFSLLNMLYTFGSSLTSSVDTMTDIITYEIADGYSVLTILLPAGFIVYLAYQLVKWFLDIVL